MGANGFSYPSFHVKIYNYTSKSIIINAKVFDRYLRYNIDGFYFDDEFDLHGGGIHNYNRCIYP